MFGKEKEIYHDLHHTWVTKRLNIPKFLFSKISSVIFKIKFLEMSRSHEPLHILFHRTRLKKLLNGQVLCRTKNPAAGGKYTYNHSRLMMIPQPLTWVEQGGGGREMLLTFYFFLREARTAQAPVLLKHLLKSAGALSAVGRPWDLHHL